MPERPIGITFQPSADAQANGPRQAGIEGQGGSDLAAAFKILNLHLPRVLGAAAIAPKRLLNSPGAAGVMAPGGVSPYSQIYQTLLQSIVGGMSGGSAGTDVMSLSSLFGSGWPYDSGGSYGGGGGSSSGSGVSVGGVLPPRISPADQPTPPTPPIGGSEYGGAGASGPTTTSVPAWSGPDYSSREDRYI